MLYKCTAYTTSIYGLGSIIGIVHMIYDNNSNA